ncbi:DEAD/DEAH box helicase family protein [Spiroplasma tabanidicola]|uniref:DEAD/DEAH box helicase n=1 Tax=Spiroplasma tabanidicola TaxID=324079 RepID=A0A6I6C5E1_9MOLU|nr:DEAD/DEAH box helicase family protein [Spiroplasma tabanidicola]QGS52067.1 DEAD/DEAH box helicase [Spiroplasma tabanidicola]
MHYSDLSSTSLVEAIKSFINKTNTFYIISPFITKEAFYEFDKELEDFFGRNGKLKIITSTFTESGESFNYDDLFYISKKYKRNIEIKVQIVKRGEKPLHKKIYGFMYENDFDIILGSANFTYRGLYGKEISSLQSNESKQNLLNEIEYMWNEQGNYKLVNFKELSKEDWIKMENNYFNPFRDKENDNSGFILKDYQQEIIEKYKEDLFEYKNHSVILPTGTGKTIVAAFMFLHLQDVIDKPKLLFTTHRTEILNNAFNRFKQIVKGFEPVLIDTNNQKIIDFESIKNKSVFVTNKLLKNLIDKNKFNKNQFDIIFYDEAHHFDNESETNIFDYIFKYFNPTNNIALTATPERRQGLESITNIFDNVLYHMELHEAIEKKLVCEINYYLMHDKSEIKLTRDDLNSEVKLLLKADNLKRNSLVLDAIRKYLEYCFTTIIFCINIEHAKRINEILINNGYNSDYLVSDDINRSEKLDKFINKKLNFLCVVDILNEGIDIPEIDSVIFLRPTQSKTIYLQQLGRGLRKFNDKKLKVIDIATNIEIKDYWLNRFCNLITETQLVELVDNNCTKFSGLTFDFDELSYNELLKKLKQQKDVLYKNSLSNYIVWDLKCFEILSETNKDFVLIFDKNSRWWYEIYEVNGDNLSIFDINDTSYNLVYKYNGLDFSEFDILKFLKITKSEDDLKITYIHNNIEKINEYSKRKINQLPYNYSLSVFPNAKYIQEGKILYKKFKENKTAYVKKTKNGYILLKNSWIYPYKRKLIDKDVIKVWNQLNVPENFDSLFEIKNDYFFARSKILADVIVGGNSSFPNELSYEDNKKLLRNHYISNICKILNKYDL